MKLMDPEDSSMGLPAGRFEPPPPPDVPPPPVLEGAGEPIGRDEGVGDPPGEPPGIPFSPIFVPPVRRLNPGSDPMPGPAHLQQAFTP